jgi:hypothetical protein
MSDPERVVSADVAGLAAAIERAVLRVGHAYQRVTAWHLEPPRFSGRGGPVIG